MTDRNPFDTLREDPFEETPVYDAQGRNQFECNDPACGHRAMKDENRCEHGTPLRARCSHCTEIAWAKDHGREPWSR